MKPCYLSRRAFCVALGATSTLLGTTLSAEAAARGPLLWLASRNRARVYLFPYGEAKDASWLTPIVERAFNESSQLWVELGQPMTPERQAQLYKELGEDSSRTFFDALEPPVRARALKYMDELNIPEDQVKHLRPWLAYYTFVTAFGKKFGRSEGFTQSSAEQTPPEFVLVDRAIKARKAIHSEVGMEEWVRKLAALPDPLQSQYLEWLFDYFDDQKAGLGEQRFDWMQGKPSNRSNERMRTKMPDLYEIMDTQRNQWWTRKIVDLLDEGGTSFIAIGQNHVLGPKGIPTMLREPGVLRAGELKLV